MDTNENDPENHLSTYKEISGGEVLKQPQNGGAGDASLSPSHVHRHTPGATLGAVRVPAIAPGANEDSCHHSTPQDRTAIPRHPLDHDTAIKFALGVAVSAELEASGPHHLLVSTPADCTAPHHLRGRRIMHAIACTEEQLNAAFSIIAGSHKAVRIRPAKP